VAVLLDETVRLQRAQQTVDGRTREIEPFGDLADPESRGGSESHRYSALSNPLR
jgi:hypothetical protein